MWCVRLFQIHLFERLRPIMHRCSPSLPMSVSFSLSFCVDFPPFSAQLVFWLPFPRIIWMRLCQFTPLFCFQDEGNSEVTDPLRFPTCLFATPQRSLPYPHGDHSTLSTPSAILPPSSLHKLHSPLIFTLIIFFYKLPESSDRRLTSLGSLDKQTKLCWNLSAISQETSCCSTVITHQILIQYLSWRPFGHLFILLWYLQQTLLSWCW